MASTHEFIEFSNTELPQVFDSIIIRGVIDSIDDEENTMDVTTDEFGPLTDVPIFYHCEDFETVEDGWSAFEEDDEVMIFCKNGRNVGSAEAKVVGFWDGRPRDCLKGEGYMYAALFDGDIEWAVIWDIKTRKYAEGILDDSDTPILRSDWPVNSAFLSNWFADTDRIGLFFASDPFGNDVGGSTVTADCSHPNCDSKTDSDSVTNHVRPDKTDTLSCSNSGCRRLPPNAWAETKRCDDPANQHHEVEYLIGYVESSRRTNAELWAGKTRLFGSWADEVEGFDVVIAEHVVSSFFFQSRSDEDWYFKCPEGAPCQSASWSFSQSTDNEQTIEIDTPWGTIFSGFQEIFTIHSSSGSASGCTGQVRDPDSCQGIAVVNQPIPNKFARSIRNIYVQEDDSEEEGEPGHAMFGVVACIQRSGDVTASLKDVNGRQACTFNPPIWREPRIEAIGAIGWFEDNNGVDINTLTAAPDVADGVVKLIQYNIDNKSYDTQTMTSMVFHHRLGKVLASPP